MCCHAQSLPEGTEDQKPEKSADIQFLGWNEAGEFREKNTPNDESLMNVEYFQNKNSSSKPKHRENKLEIEIRKLDVDRQKKIKTQNANTAFSEKRSVEENSFPVSEHGLAKKLLSQDKRATENKIYVLDNRNSSREKQSGKHGLGQGQKCKDLVLVAEMDCRDKGHSTKIPGENTELQKVFCEKAKKKASFAKKEKQRKRDNGDEEKRSTTVKVPGYLCNASETVNFRMILNPSKSTFK